MRKVRSGLLAAALALTSTAFALPTFGPVFNSTYGVKKDSDLTRVKCGVCHVGMSSKLNPYGEDLKKAMVSENTGKKLTGSVLKRVEGLDSDKDGTKNLEEIKANKNPGDPKSK